MLILRLLSLGTCGFAVFPAPILHLGYQTGAALRPVRMAHRLPQGCWPVAAGTQQRQKGVLASLLACGVFLAGLNAATRLPWLNRCTKVSRSSSPLLTIRDDALPATNSKHKLERIMKQAEEPGRATRDDGVCRRAVVWSAAFALLAPAVASAATAETSVFVGRYTDPKHPGGYREITLLPGAKIGPYMLANVHGGQGTGEPESYDLPAFIAEKKDWKRIIIDFSTPPKYGPADFRGVWDPKKRGISFYDDGNFWPKQK